MARAGPRVPAMGLQQRPKLDTQTYEMEKVRGLFFSGGWAGKRPAALFLHDSVAITAALLRGLAFTYRAMREKRTHVFACIYRFFVGFNMFCICYLSL